MPGVLPSMFFHSKVRSNNMITDDTIIFNGYGALSKFDYHEARLRYLIQRHTLPTLKDRRHLLSVCEEADR